jgi:hypothetical protein
LGLSDKYGHWAVLNSSWGCWQTSNGQKIQSAVQLLGSTASIKVVGLNTGGNL